MTFEALKSRIRPVDEFLWFNLSIMAMIEESPLNLVLGVSVRQSFLKTKFRKQKMLDKLYRFIDDGTSITVIYDYDKDRRRGTKAEDYFHKIT